MKFLYVSAFLWTTVIDHSTKFMCLIMLGLHLDLDLTLSGKASGLQAERNCSSVVNKRSASESTGKDVSTDYLEKSCDHFKSKFDVTVVRSPHFMCILKSKVFASWSEAKHNCELWGAEFATLHNEHVKDSVFQALSGTNTFYWVGAMREHKYETIRWIDNQAEVSQPMWAHGSSYCCCGAIIQQSLMVLGCKTHFPSLCTYHFKDEYTISLELTSGLQRRSYFTLGQTVTISCNGSMGKIENLEIIMTDQHGHSESSLSAKDEIFNNTIRNYTVDASYRTAGTMCVKYQEIVLELVLETKQPWVKISCTAGGVTKTEFTSFCCPDHTYGEDCEKNCSRNCLFELCDSETGFCNCTEHAEGPRCETKVCPPTFYGEKCDEYCSEYCFDVLCNSTTGKCYNCTAGRHGDFCTGQVEAESNVMFFYYYAIGTMALVALIFLLLVFLQREGEHSTLGEGEAWTSESFSAEESYDSSYENGDSNRASSTRASIKLLGRKSGRVSSTLKRDQQSIALESNRMSSTIKSQRSSALESNRKSSTERGQHSLELASNRKSSTKGDASNRKSSTKGDNILNS